MFPNKATMWMSLQNIRIHRNKKSTWDPWTEKWPLQIHVILILIRNPAPLTPKPCRRLQFSHYLYLLILLLGALIQGVLYQLMLQPDQ